MKLERTKNAGRNIFFGTILKIYQITIPFIIRTAMIYYLGIKYVGLNSLFTSILQVLNLAELGVGSAMIFSMYKPIAEDDTETICALMQLYKVYYRIIGWVILVAGLLLIPFLRLLIKGDLPPNINLYTLYLLNLGSTVASYWLFAYKNCLLTAHQRNDISSKMSLVISTIEYALELVGIVAFKNYYFYLIIKLLSQLLNNIAVAQIVKKIYPSYNPCGKLDKGITNEINRKVKDLFMAKLGGVIVNSADSIVISSFLGLTILAIYNNYYYILSSIIGFLTIIFCACIAGIGNSLVTESEKKNYKDFQLFTFILVWIVGFCTSSLLCLFQPFMKVWVKDYSKMLGMPEVICFCIYFLVYEIASIMIQYKDAAGMWHEDRYRPLVTALTNLVLNIVLVQYIGLLGVLLSTIISFVLIGIPWLLRNLFTVVFHISPNEYIRKLILYSVVTVVTSAGTYVLCSLVPYTGVIELVIKGGICCVIPNITFYVLYCRFEEFEKAKKILFRIWTKASNNY